MSEYALHRLAADFHGLDLWWCVEIDMPFVYGLSKNAAHKQRKGGGVYLTDTAVAWRMSAVALIKAGLREKHITPYVGKVWVNIFVTLPDHRGDAINVIEQACDAIKIAVGVDDRWFAIDRLDWRIDRAKPGIRVAIGQEAADVKLKGRAA